MNLLLTKVSREAKFCSVGCCTRNGSENAELHSFTLHKRQVLTARCVQITQQRGLSEADSALLISLIGFFNTGGRIVSGAITDHPRVDALFLTTLAIFSGDTSRHRNI